MPGREFLAGSVPTAFNLFGELRSQPLGRVTLSIGVTNAALDQLNEEVAVNQADDLLYKAKEGGRNRVASASNV